ncbi:MAG: DNA polymerase III subunit delta [Endomicrobiia bacterium]
MIISYKEFYKDLEKFLNNEKIYFFFGENNYYMIEMLNIIYEKLGSIFKETIYLWDAEIEDLSKKITTSNLFFQKTLTVIRFFNLNEKRSFKKDLVDFIKNYKIDNYLIVMYEQNLNERESNEEIINYFLKNCLCIRFDNLTKEEIFQKFIPKKVDFNLTEEAKEILCEYTNNDLWLLSNELEKLKYYSLNKKEISEDEIYECCSIYETKEIKELIDAVETKDLRNVLNIIDNLLSQEIFPLQIFVAIYRYFRKKFLYKKIETTKVYKILKELQITDFKLKTSMNSRYIIENFIISLMKIYSE